MRPRRTALLRRLAAPLALGGLAAPAPGSAGPADVVDANARCRGNVCTVWAAVLHTDEGWEHYVDYFEVLTEDGEVLARRVLLHPHVDEQPFRRAVQSLEIPPGTRRLRVRAHDTMHGTIGRTLVVELPPETEPQDAEQDPD